MSLLSGFLQALLVTLLPGVIIVPMVVLPILLLLLVVVPIAMWSAAAVRRRREELHATARTLGLGIEPGGFWSAGATLRGEIDGVRVSRAPHVVSSGKSSQRFTRFVGEGAPFGLTIVREGPGQGLLKLFGAEDRLVGDPAFDAEAVIKGDEWQVGVALSLEARVAIRRLFAGGGRVTIEGGRVMVQLNGDVTALEPVRHHLRAVAAVVAALRFDAAGARERLARTVREDPAEGVRLRGVELLVAHGVAAAEPALREALADPVPEVRARAALALRDVGALRALLGAAGLPPADRLAVAEALGTAEVIPAALALLGEDDATVRLGAARVLGRVGAVEQVEALYAVAERDPARGVRTVAKEAMQAIQSRLPGAEAGRIALAPGAPMTGALGLAPAGRGAVAEARVVQVKTSREGG